MCYQIKYKQRNKLCNLAIQVVKRLQNAGFKAFWAGGCVRDMIMNRTPEDYDIATDATPDQISQLFSKSIMIGKSFGVVKVIMDEAFFEVATFRKDCIYKDGRRPQKVEFSNPETDAKRRDFTINAIFYDPVTKKIHDYIGGIKDIEARIIRCVGQPEERFKEDHLRLLRAVRFASVLEFTLNASTANAIKAQSHLLSNISSERIKDEFTRILIEPNNAGNALVLIDKLSLINSIIPEITAMKGQNQPREFHPEGDVFEHTIMMLNLMENPSLHLAYSVLLHDIGKPVTASFSNNRIRFNNHAHKGAILTRQILRKLHFSSRDIETISYCVKNHMRFMEVQNMKQSTLRKLVGAPTFDIELELHRLDCMASNGNLDNYHFLIRFLKDNRDKAVLPTPWITGYDIINMGIPEGPEVGIWRKKAYDAQLEERFTNRKTLLKWLTRIIH